MTQTAIIECPHCSGLLLAPMDQKTRTCPFCNTRIELHKAKRLAKAVNAIAASEILRKIKTERKDNAHNPDRKSKSKQL
jgi:uncharacterized Zn finger protein (UPF0148 family)